VTDFTLLWPTYRADITALTMLGPRLDNLSFDILYEVATLLDYRDYIHLSRVNYALRGAMQSQYISRKIVEVLHTSFPHMLLGPQY
jgi:hypothetical protein